MDKFFIQEVLDDRCETSALRYQNYGIIFQNICGQVHKLRKLMFNYTRRVMKFIIFSITNILIILYVIMRGDRK
jgi:hypothetical protein